MIKHPRHPAVVAVAVFALQCGVGFLWSYAAFHGLIGHCRPDLLELYTSEVFVVYNVSSLLLPALVSSGWITFIFHKSERLTISMGLVFLAAAVFAQHNHWLAVRACYGATW